MSFLSPPVNARWAHMHLIVSVRDLTKIDTGRKDTTAAGQLLCRNGQLLALPLENTGWAHFNVKLHFLFCLIDCHLIKCPGLTCGINIVKPRFLFKTVDLWSYILPINRYSHTL